MKRRRRAWLGAGVLGLGVGVTACTYDFDQFVVERAGGASAAGAAGIAAGGTGAGRAGSTAGKSGAAGVAGRGSASGGSGNAANGGEGGSGGEGDASGTGGTDATGGSTAAGKGGGGGQGGSAGSAQAGKGGSPSAGASGSASSSCASVKGTSSGGHCYFVLGEDTPLDFSAATKACQAHSSKTHLATLTSAGEQAIVAQAFFPSSLDAWIGLALDDESEPPSLCQLLPKECPFHWLTSEELDYTDWAMRSGSDDEPNYSGACVRLQAADQAWGDTSCTSAYRAICEDDG